LDRDECAFFIFNHLDDHSFWNRNVSFPISLLFMDENFEIRGIGSLKENQEEPCRGNFPLIKYVLEGHKDLPFEHNIQQGDFCIPEDNKIKIVKGKRNQEKNYTLLE
jgi:uncharacterized membrane protein (UPF0127 family)